MQGYYVIKNKKQVKDFLKKTRIKTQKNLADIIGIGEDYMSQIMNGKPTTKVTAYAMCKAISSNLEIENIFEIF